MQLWKALAHALIRFRASLSSRQTKVTPMKHISKAIGVFGLALFMTSSAQAWDFLYVQHTIESARLVAISPIGIDGKGSITVVDECDICPDSMPYTRNTELTTPFGENQPISDLVKWQGNPAMVRYSLTTKEAIYIEVYSVTTDQAE